MMHGQKSIEKFTRTLPVFVIQLAASRTHFLYTLLYAQLFKNFLALSRTRSFTSVSTRVRVWSLSWTRWI